MIGIDKNEKMKIIVTDEELEFLAETYLKLKQNPTFQNFSQSFQDFIMENLEKDIKVFKEFKQGG